jgi:hypothetical protein
MKEEELIKQLQFGGFYKSYKHQPDAELGNFIYQVLNITSVKDLGKNFVTYRPLYKSFVYNMGQWNDGKEISEWFKPLPSGQIRYSLIEPGSEEYRTCEQLIDELYGKSFFGDKKNTNM